MARIFGVLAFFLVLGAIIPFVNAISPFQNGSAGNPSSNFNSNLILNATGCSKPGANGVGACNAGINPTGASSGNVFGQIVNTIFIFGYFVAAVNFLVQIAQGVFLPGVYIYQWLMIFGDSTAATAMAAAYNAIVWFVYAMGLFYIIANRDLEH